MAEPTTTLSIAGMGVAAGILAALGLSPHALFWALVGCTLGLSVAPQVGRMRAVIVFVCASLSSALLGILVASVAFAPALMQLASAGLALIFGLLFHPGMTAAVGLLPLALKGVLFRLGLGGDQRGP